MAACLATLSLAASASPAAASVTIGQTGSVGETCAAPADYLKPTVTSGNAYVVPAVGTITSWSHLAGSNLGQMAKMKVFRKVADPATYQVVAHDGPRSLTPNVLSTFATSIAVMPGDLLGLTPVTSAANAVVCLLNAPGTFLRRMGDLADGESGAFTSIGGGHINVSAVVTPSNAFTFGDVRRNQRKGSATLEVSVPNPGELALSGKGVKTAGAAGAFAAATVIAPGGVELLIKAKGKKRRKLNETGKVKVSFDVTYTPTGGDPSTQSKRLKLKKR